MILRFTSWLRLLAPYLAVCLFWVGWSQAWLAILTYHVQILLWYRFGRWIRARPRENRWACYLLFVCIMAGPMVYYLLPQLAVVPIRHWLQQYRLDGVSLILMIPYFGLLHPILEQLHWDRLRSEKGWAHPLFAGYHVIVLYQLLPASWLLLIFVGLCALSWLWKTAGNTQRARMYCMFSHIAADLGIMIAVYLLMYG